MKIWHNTTYTSLLHKKIRSSAVINVVYDGYQLQFQCDASIQPWCYLLVVKPNLQQKTTAKNLHGLEAHCAKALCSLSFQSEVEKTLCRRMDNWWASSNVVRAPSPGPGCIPWAAVSFPPFWNKTKISHLRMRCLVAEGKWNSVSDWFWSLRSKCYLTWVTLVST